MKPVERAKINEGVAARHAAFALLNHVTIKNRTLEDALDIEKEQVSALSKRDNAFARLLVALVLKRKLEIDNILQGFLPNGSLELKPVTLINIFRLSIAQFVFLTLPAYTVVNTAVDLIEMEGISHHKDQVGEVLRRLTLDPITALSKEEAGRINTPKWLWEEWMRDYGEEAATQIAVANFGEAALDVSVKEDVEKWKKVLGAFTLPTGTLRKESDNFIQGLESLSESSDWWVQSAVAALPVRFFGDVHGKTIIDLCSAPGGKTVQLALMGANVIAVERSAKNMSRLRQNIEKLGLEKSVKIIVADGSVWKTKEKADGVLLDAPCTETGTLRYRPDILSLSSYEKQEHQVARQRRLIDNASKMLKREGVLVYCSSSIQKAEGERQLDWVREHNLPLSPLPIRVDEVSGVENMITPRGEFRSFPFQWDDIGGIDGFYIARFMKV